MKRLFVAVDISEQARAVAADRISLLRTKYPDVKVGWEKPEKLHITLKFLGRTEDTQVAEISKHLSGISRDFQPFRLEMSTSGVFPSQRNPRILWLGINDNELILGNLAERVIDEITKLGFDPEKRSYKAHLTIARIKEPQLARPLAEKHLQTHFEPVSFDVSEIVLYESQLRPTGSVYTKLKTFRLSK